MTETIISGGMSLIGIILSAVILRQQTASEKNRKDGQERMGVILECSEASLDGLHQLGCNGAVTAARERLAEYKNKKASC